MVAEVIASPSTIPKVVKVCHRQQTRMYCIATKVNAPGVVEYGREVVELRGQRWLICIIGERKEFFFFFFFFFFPKCSNVMYVCNVAVAWCVWVWCSTCGSRGRGRGGHGAQCGRVAQEWVAQWRHGSEVYVGACKVSSVCR